MGKALYLYVRSVDPGLDGYLVGQGLLVSRNFKVPCLCVARASSTEFKGSS